MVPVFSRAPSKPCSKTIVRMVLVAAVALPGSVALGELAGEPWGLWRAWIGFGSAGRWRLFVDRQKVATRVLVASGSLA